jgi:hypothetical protein
VTTRLLLPSASVSNQSGWEQMKCVICAPGVLKRVTLVLGTTCNDSSRAAGGMDTFHTCWISANIIASCQYQRLPVCGFSSSRCSKIPNLGYFYTLQEHVDY